MSNRTQMIKALNEFRKAYYGLEEAWESFDLDVMADNSTYPFAESFDELNVPGWCDCLVNQLATMSRTSLEQKIDKALLIIRCELVDFYKDNNDIAQQIDDEEDILQDIKNCPALQD